MSPSIPTLPKPAARFNNRQKPELPNFSNFPDFTNCAKIVKSVKFY
jgi:hypothetical protein